MSLSINDYDRKLGPSTYNIKQIDDLLLRSRDTARERDEFNQEPPTSAKNRQQYNSVSPERLVSFYMNDEDQFKRVIRLESEIERLTNQLKYQEQRKKNIIDMEKQIEGLSQTINHWRDQCMKKDEDIDKLYGQLKNQQSSQNANQTLKTEIIQLKNKVAHLDQLNAKKMQDNIIQDLHSQIDDLNDKLKEKNKEIANLKIPPVKLDTVPQEEFQYLRRENNQLRDELQTFMNKLRSISREKDSLQLLPQQAPSDFNQELQHLRQLNENLDRKCRFLDNENQILKKNINDLENEIGHLTEHQIDGRKYDYEYNQLLQENQHLKRECQDLQNEYNRLRKLNDQIIQQDKHNTIDPQQIQNLKQQLDSLQQRHQKLINEQRQVNDYLKNFFDGTGQDDEQIRTLIQSQQMQLKRYQDENYALKDALFKQTKHSDAWCF